MDLVERYVGSVKPFLPWGQRDDIASELTEAIRGRLDERQAELGRPLTKTEQEVVIQEFGHPLLMAGRYGPQRTLIGPELFPLWWMAVRLLVGICALSTFARGVADALMARTPSGMAEAWVHAWTGFISNAVFLVGLATIAFAAGQWLKLQPLKEWRVKDLQPMRLTRRPNRFESAFGLFFVLLATVWWAGLPFAQDVFPQLYLPLYMLSSAGLVLAPAWYPLVWGLLLASIVAEAGYHLAGVIDPQAGVKRGVCRIAGSLLGIAAAVVLLNAGPLVSLAPGSPLDAAVAGADTLDRILRIGAWFAVAIGVITVAVRLWLLARRAG